MTEPKHLDAKLHIIDRQIHDRDGDPVAVVDDLEISDIPQGQELDPEADAPVLTNLLTGPVLATRIFGGRPPSSRWHRIPWENVTDVGVTVDLDLPRDEMAAAWVERWMQRHVISRIPGGTHDSQ